MDILSPGLKIVICGSDVGPKLFEMLHRVHLTPRQVEKPEELLEFGIGLTDTIDRKKIRELAPGTVVFNGKQPVKDFLDMPTASFGPQKWTIGTSKCFVCPSTKTSSDPRWWELMTKLL